MKIILINRGNKIIKKIIRFCIQVVQNKPNGLAILPGLMVILICNTHFYDSSEILDEFSTSGISKRSLRCDFYEHL